MLFDRLRLELVICPESDSIIRDLENCLFK